VRNRRPKLDWNALAVEASAEGRLKDRLRRKLLPKSGNFCGLSVDERNLTGQSIRGSVLGDDVCALDEAESLLD
jgi:hypothetical protein